jgi:hypothetical protein
MWLSTAPNTRLRLHVHHVIALCKIVNICRRYEEIISKLGPIFEKNISSSLAEIDFEREVRLCPRRTPFASFTCCAPMLQSALRASAPHGFCCRIVSARLTLP